MYFINLKDIKIEKQYNYQTYGTTLNWDSTIPAAKMLLDATDACTKLFAEKPSIAASYEFTLSPIDDAEVFESVVNIVLGAFFKAFCNDKGRPREHRLDVPTKLAAAHTSITNMKRAVNHQTVADIFNIVIKSGEYTYYLVDSKEYENA